VAIAEPEAAEFHIARGDLRALQQVLGRLEQHRVEALPLLSRGLRERGTEAGGRVVQPVSVRPTGAHGAGDSNGLLGIHDVVRQTQTGCEGLAELEWLAVIIQILPALGWLPDDQLQKDVESRKPWHVVGSPVLPGVRARVKFHNINERPLRNALRIVDCQRDPPDLALYVVDAQRRPTM